MFRKLSQKLGKNFGRKIMLLVGAGAGMSFFLADARARQEYLLTKEKPKRAVCVMRGNGVYGIAHFGQVGDKFPVEIRASFSGLTPGKHGFHIHEWGDNSDGCTTAGGHFNPYSRKHGGPDDDERHEGDLGNVEADTKGEARYFRADSNITLYGPNSIVGRSLVIHRDEDDLGKGGHEDSATTGHAGPRLACGVIGMAKPINM
jgi:Cu-Zn family superoxide dismutase